MSFLDHEYSICAGRLWVTNAAGLFGLIRQPFQPGLIFAAHPVWQPHAKKKCGRH